MPRFGGLNLGNIGGALARNAIGSVASAVLPRNVFSGFGVKDTSVTGVKSDQNSQNRRVSLRPKPLAKQRVYGNGLLRPLAATDGLVWPYTPSITYSHPIQYESVNVVHANQNFHVFSRTDAVSLQVSGEFSVQNQLEGQYALAAIHFLRTMAKMNFGESDPLAGTPPPVLLFNAYGAFVFNDLPVIVKDFNVEFPDSVDYVLVEVAGSAQVQTPGQAAVIRDNRIVQENLPPLPGVNTNSQYNESRLAVGTPGTIMGLLNGNRGTFGGALETLSPATPSSVNPQPQKYQVWLPSLFKIGCTLVVQHTPTELRKRFNLPAYRDGANNQKDFV